jgi:hypothetical protein
LCVKGVIDTLKTPKNFESFNNQKKVPGAASGTIYKCKNTNYE